MEASTSSSVNRREAIVFDSSDDEDLWDRGMLDTEGSLGLEALALLEQFSDARDAAPRTPPHGSSRQEHHDDTPTPAGRNGRPYSPIGSPIAGPSLYQKTRRPKGYSHVKAKSRDLRHSRGLSFSQTQMEDLDIDALLESYDDRGETTMGLFGPVLHEVAEEGASGDPVSSSSDGELSPPLTAVCATFPAPPSSGSTLIGFAASRTSPVSSPAIRASMGVFAPIAPEAPKRKTSLFPKKLRRPSALRKESTTFLTPAPLSPILASPNPSTNSRSPTGDAFPASEDTFDSPATSPSTSPSFSRLMIGSLQRATSVSSTSSSPISTRSSYSYASSYAGRDSFRWSYASGSTGMTTPTIDEHPSDRSPGSSRKSSLIPEEDDRRYSIASSASYGARSSTSELQAPVTLASPRSSVDSERSNTSSSGAGKWIDSVAGGADGKETWREFVDSLYAETFAEPFSAPTPIQFSLACYDSDDESPLGRKDRRSKLPRDVTRSRESSGLTVNSSPRSVLTSSSTSTIRAHRSVASLISSEGQTLHKSASNSSLRSRRSERGERPAIPSRSTSLKKVSRSSDKGKAKAVEV